MKEESESHGNLPGFNEFSTCLRCLKELELHQPDLERAGRLLGVCPQCHDWYLIDDLEKIAVPIPLLTGKTKQSHSA